MKGLYCSIFVFLIFVMVIPAISIAEDGESRLGVEVELGPVWQSRNDVRIPNNESSTRFSLVDLIDRGPYPAGRIYFSWQIKPKHGLRILLAPLSVMQQGILVSPVSFAGEDFDPSIQTEATYKFNSFRLTYRYRFLDRPRWIGWIGFTAKIRDAKIQLEQEGKSSQKTDLGFVPLLHLSMDYRLAERWRLLFDLDALAGGPGRAEDFSLKIGYQLNRHLRITGGYRTVEGGADVDAVYTFAWLHYLVVSAVCLF
ncbi:hypothetical protein JW824_09580 [bacterium]|nr:hypothetical protein [bacterium]RQV94340.1 MAG: hypothetical protein EH221_07780 [bacterium]